MLATGVHSQPGVYALLIGSGVSTAAGVPTGWDVVKELVRRAATATDPDDAEAGNVAAADPATWWASHGDGTELGYSTLLSALGGGTPAGRSGLLKKFFEPSVDDSEQGLKAPTPAHWAIATLVKRGLIRVIVTTNFDRLLERALEDAGVSPQVVARPEAVVGMTPLHQVPVTVIKLHGDYADLATRNTIDELATYPPEWQFLLDRVLAEYGLLICGWSAVWDATLVASLERDPVRRYPLYWDSRSSKGEAAQRLIAQHRGTTIAATTADDLFTGLLTRLDALDRLAEPPLTTAIAVTRLKRYLPDPVRRIDLYDLVMDQTTPALERIAEQPVYAHTMTFERIQEIYAALLEATRPLLTLTATGVFYDRDRQYNDLWIGVLQRLLQTRAQPADMYTPELETLRHYPALLTMRAAGIVATSAGRDDVMLTLFERPTWRNFFDNRQVLPAIYALIDPRVLSGNQINGMPRWNGTTWIYPHSKLLREELRDVVDGPLIAGRDYTQACDRYEYRAALAQATIDTAGSANNAASGEFSLDSLWTSDDGPREEVAFRAEAAQADDEWPWWRLVGGRDGLDETLLALRAHLRGLRRW